MTLVIGSIKGMTGQMFVISFEHSLGPNLTYFYRELNLQQPLIRKSTGLSEFMKPTYLSLIVYP